MSDRIDLHVVYAGAIATIVMGLGAPLIAHPGYLMPLVSGSALFLVLTPMVLTRWHDLSKRGRTPERIRTARLYLLKNVIVAIGFGCLVAATFWTFS